MANYEKIMSLIREDIEYNELLLKEKVSPEFDEKYQKIIHLFDNLNNFNKPSVQDVFLVTLFLTNMDKIEYEDIADLRISEINLFNENRSQKNIPQMLNGSLVLPIDIMDSDLVRECPGLEELSEEYDLRLFYAEPCVQEYRKLKISLAKAVSINEKKFIYRHSVFKELIDKIVTLYNQYIKYIENINKEAKKTLKYYHELEEKINTNELSEMLEIPEDWYNYLSFSVLEELQYIIIDNLNKKYHELEERKSNLDDNYKATKLRDYLFNEDINYNSINPDTLTILENTDNIIYKINFLKNLGFTNYDLFIRNYHLLAELTDEKIEFIEDLIKKNLIRKSTILNNEDILLNNFNKLKINTEILNKIINQNNVFYNDEILLLDSIELKNRISVLKEYKLNINNFTYLISNYEYLNIYDLIIENDIPKYLLPSICNTENPYNTIRRILVYYSISEDIESNNKLKEELLSEEKFLILDDELNDYLDDIHYATNLIEVVGDSINDITKNELVIYLDENFRNEDLYIFGDIKISRPKFLKNFEKYQDNENLINCLVSGSIISVNNYNLLLQEIEENGLRKH